MENKTCTSGHPCLHRYMDTGTTGWGCQYWGYCDFQLPRDSRGQKDEVERINTQKFLIDNTLDDLILNDRGNTKPEDRIYVSDALKKYATALESHFQEREIWARIKEIGNMRIMIQDFDVKPSEYLDILHERIKRLKQTLGEK